MTNKMNKCLNKNNHENNVVDKDLNQLSIELGWINRELLSSYLAFLGTYLVIIVRTSRRIAKLDEINNTNYAESTVIAGGMVATDIIETFPPFLNDLFLVLAINSTEISFENLVNIRNLSGATESDINRVKQGLAASYFAYWAAKISHDLDVATESF